MCSRCDHSGIQAQGAETTWGKLSSWWQKYKKANGNNLLRLRGKWHTGHWPDRPALPDARSTTKESEPYDSTKSQKGHVYLHRLNPGWLCYGPRVMTLCQLWCTQRLGKCLDMSAHPVTALLNHKTIINQARLGIQTPSDYVGYILSCSVKSVSLPSTSQQFPLNSLTHSLEQAQQRATKLSEPEQPQIILYK